MVRIGDNLSTDSSSPDSASEPDQWSRSALKEIPENPADLNGNIDVFTKQNANEIRQLLQYNPEFFSLSGSLQLFANDKGEALRQGIKLSESEKQLLKVAEQLDSIYNHRNPWQTWNLKELCQEAEAAWQAISSADFLNEFDRELLCKASLGLLAIVRQYSPVQGSLLDEATKTSVKILISIKDYSAAREILEYYRLARHFGDEVSVDSGMSVNANMSVDPALSLDPEINKLFQEIEKTPYERESEVLRGFRDDLRNVQFAYFQAMQLKLRAEHLRKQGNKDLSFAFVSRAEEQFQGALQLFQRLFDRSKGRFSSLRFEFELEMMHFAILDARGDYAEAREALGRVVAIEVRMLNGRALSPASKQEARQVLEQKLKNYDEKLLGDLCKLEAFTKRQKRTKRDLADLEKIVKWHEALKNVPEAIAFYDEDGDPVNPNPSPKNREHYFWKQELQFVKNHNMIEQLKKLRKQGESEKVEALALLVDAQLKHWEATLPPASKWRRDVYKFKIELCEQLGREEEMLAVVEEAYRQMPAQFSKLRDGKRNALKASLKDLEAGIVHLQSVLYNKSSESRELATKSFDHWQEELRVELDLADLCQKYRKVAKQLGSSSSLVDNISFELYRDLAFRFKLSHKLYESFLGSDAPERHHYQAIALRSMLEIDRVIPQVVDVEGWSVEQRRAFLLAGDRMNLATSAMSEADQEIFAKARQTRHQELISLLEKVPADLDYRWLRQEGYGAFEDVLQLIGNAQKMEQTQPAECYRQYQKALELLKAKKIDPANAKVYLAECLIYAEILDNLGQCTEAMKYLATARKCVKEKLPEKTEEIEAKFQGYGRHLLERGESKLQSIVTEGKDYDRQITVLRDCIEIYTILRDEYQAFQAYVLVDMLQKHLTEVQQAKERGEPFAFKLYREAFEVRMQNRMTLYHDKLIQIRDYTADSTSKNHVILYKIVSKELSSANREFIEQLRNFVETNRAEANQYVFDPKTSRRALLLNDSNRRDKRAEEMMLLFHSLEVLDETEEKAHTISERMEVLTRLNQSGKATKTQQNAYRVLVNLKKKDKQVYVLLREFPEVLPAAFAGDEAACRRVLTFIRELRGARDASQMVAQWLEPMFGSVLAEVTPQITDKEKQFYHDVEHSRDRFLQNYREVTLALAKMNRLEYANRFGEEGPTLDQMKEMCEEVADIRYEQRLMARQEELRKSAFHKVEAHYLADLQKPVALRRWTPVMIEAWELYKDVTDCLDKPLELSDATIRHIQDEAPWQAALAVVTAGVGNKVRAGVLGFQLARGAGAGRRIYSALRLATTMTRSAYEVERSVERYKLISHLVRWSADAVLYEGFDSLGRRRDFDWSRVPVNFASNAALFGPNLALQGRYVRGGYSLKDIRSMPWLPRRAEWQRMRAFGVGMDDLRHVPWFNWDKLRRLAKYEAVNGSAQIGLSMAVGLTERYARDEMPLNWDEWKMFLGDVALSTVVADKADRGFNAALRHFGRKVDGRSWSVDDWVEGIEARLTMEGKVYGILMYRPDWKDHLFSPSEKLSEAERRVRTLNFISKAPHDVLETIAKSQPLTRNDFQSDADYAEYKKQSDEAQRRSNTGLEAVPPKEGVAEAPKEGEANHSAPRTHPAEDPFYKPVEGVDYKVSVEARGIVVKVLQPPHDPAFLDLYLMQISRDILEKVGSGELGFLINNHRRIVLEAFGWTTEVLPGSHLEELLQDLAESLNLSLSIKLFHPTKGWHVPLEFYPGRRQAEALAALGRYPGRLSETVDGKKVDPAVGLLSENKELGSLMEQQISLLEAEIQKLPDGSGEAKTDAEREQRGEEKATRELYQEQLDDIRRRASFSQEQIGWIELALPEISSRSARRGLKKQLRDIRDRQDILFRRLGGILADLLSPDGFPGDERGSPRGLRDIDKAQRQPTAKKVAPAAPAEPAKPSTEIPVEVGPDGKEYQQVKTDKNYPFGFGDEVQARPHQIEPVNKMRAQFKRLIALHGSDFQGEAFRRAGVRSLHPMIDLNYSFEMETGTGKTLTLAAMAAALIESELFNAKRGDVIPIMIHRKDLVEQIKDTLLQVVPYANRKIGHHAILKVYQRRGSRKATYFKAQLRDGKWVWEQIRLKSNDKPPKAQFLVISVQSADSDKASVKKSAASTVDVEDGGEEAFTDRGGDKRELKDFEEELQNDLGKDGRIPGFIVDESQGIERAEENNKTALREHLRSENRDHFYAKTSHDKDYGVWLNTEFALRRRTPNAIRMTFTATRHPGKGPAFHTLSARDAMQRKQIPHTYVGKVGGPDLEKVRTRKTAEGETEFYHNEIVEVLKKPNSSGIRQYHEDAFLALAMAKGEEKEGWITEQDNPRGQRRALPIIGITRDRELASLGVQDHRALCQKYTKRNVIALGNAEKRENVGKIDVALYDKLVKVYWSGKAYDGPDIDGVIKNGEYVDGIAVALSGNTNPDLRMRILRDMAAFGDKGPGPVEAIFGSEILRVGIDVPEAYVLFNFDPSFKRGRVGQVKGRLQRFDKAHVNPDGTLKRNHPKLIIEPIYKREGLVYVGDLYFGAQKYREMPMTTMLDPLSGQKVDKVKFNESTDTEYRRFDVSGMPRLRSGGIRGAASAGEASQPAKPEAPAKPAKEPSKRQKREWAHLGQELRAVMERDFNNDPAWLAIYLQEDPAFVEGLLKGRGWAEIDVERLATLLYLEDRELFARMKADVLVGEQGDKRLSQNSAYFYAVLATAYEKMQEANPDHDFELQDFAVTQVFNGQSAERAFSKEWGAAIGTQSLKPGDYRKATAAMALYFRQRAQHYEGLAAKNPNDNGLFNEFARAQGEYDALVEQGFRYRGWPYQFDAANTPALAYAKLLQMAREVVVVDLQGVLAGSVLADLPLQGPEAPLRRWIEHGHVSDDTATLLTQTEILLKAAGHSEKEIKVLLNEAAKYLQEVKDKASKLRPIVSELDKIYNEVQAKLKADPSQDSAEEKPAEPADKPKDPNEDREAAPPRPRSLDPLHPWNRLLDLRELASNPEVDATDKARIDAIIKDAEAKLAETLSDTTSDKGDPTADVKDKKAEKGPSPTETKAPGADTEPATKPAADDKTASKKDAKEPVKSGDDKKTASKFEDSDEFQLLEDAQKQALKNYIRKNSVRGSLYPNDKVLAELLADDAVLARLQAVEPDHWLKESSAILWAAYDDYVLREWMQILSLNEIDARALLQVYLLTPQAQSHRRTAFFTIDRSKILATKPVKAPIEAPVPAAAPAHVPPTVDVTPVPPNASPAQAAKPEYSIPSQWISDPDTNQKSARGRLRAALAPVLAEKARGKLKIFLNTNELKDFDRDIRKFLTTDDVFAGSAETKSKVILNLRKLITKLDLSPAELGRLEDLLVDFAAEELGWQEVPAELEFYLKGFRRRFVLATGGHIDKRNYTPLIADETAQEINTILSLMKKPVLVSESLDAIQVLSTLRHYDMELRAQEGNEGSLEERRSKVRAEFGDEVLALVPLTMLGKGDNKGAYWLRLQYIVERTAKRYNVANRLSTQESAVKSTIAKLYPAELAAELNKPLEQRLDVMQPDHQTEVYGWLMRGLVEFSQTPAAEGLDPVQVQLGLVHDSWGFLRNRELGGSKQAAIYHQIKEVLCLKGLGMISDPAVVKRMEPQGGEKLRALHVWVGLVSMETGSTLSPARAEALYQKHIRNLPGFPGEDLPTLRDFYEGPVRLLLALDLSGAPKDLLQLLKDAQAELGPAKKSSSKSTKNPSGFESSPAFIALKVDQQQVLRAYLARYPQGLRPDDALLAILSQDAKTKGALQDLTEAEWAKSSDALLWKAYNDHLIEEWQKILDLSPEDAKALVDVYILDSAVAGYRQANPLVVEKSNFVAPAKKAELPSGWMGDSEVNSKTARGRLREALIPLILEGATDGKVYVFVREKGSREAENVIRKIMAGEEALGTTPQKKSEAILALLKFVRSLGLEPTALSKLEDRLVDFAMDELGWERISEPAAAYFGSLQRRVILHNGGLFREVDFPEIDNSKMLNILFNIVRIPHLFFENNSNTLDMMKYLKLLDFNVRKRMGESEVGLEGKILDELATLLPITPIFKDSSEPRWERVIDVVNSVTDMLVRDKKNPTKMDRAEAAARAFPMELIRELNKAPRNSVNIMDDTAYKQIMADLKRGLAFLASQPDYAAKGITVDDLLATAICDSMGYKRYNNSGTRNDIQGHQLELYSEITRVLAHEGLGIADFASMKDRLGEDSFAKWQALQTWVCLVTLEGPGPLTPQRAEELYRKHIQAIPNFPREQFKDLASFYEGPVRALLKPSPRSPIERNLSQAIAELRGQTTTSAKPAKASPPNAADIAAEIRVLLKGAEVTKQIIPVYDVGLGEDDRNVVAKNLDLYINEGIPLDDLMKRMSDPQKVAFLRSLEGPLARVMPTSLVAQEKIEALAKAYLPEELANKLSTSTALQQNLSKVRTTLGKIENDVLDAYVNEPALGPEEQKTRKLVAWGIRQIQQGKGFNYVERILKNGRNNLTPEDLGSVPADLTTGLIAKAHFYRECWQLLQKSDPVAYANGVYDELFVARFESIDLESKSASYYQRLMRNLANAVKGDYYHLQVGSELLFKVFEQRAQKKYTSVTEVHEELEVLRGLYLAAIIEEGRLTANDVKNKTEKYHKELAVYDNITFAAAVLRTDRLENIQTNTAGQKFYKKAVVILAVSDQLRLEGHPAVSLWLRIGDLIENPYVKIHGRDIIEIYAEVLDLCRERASAADIAELARLGQDAAVELQTQLRTKRPIQAKAKSKTAEATLTTLQIPSEPELAKKRADFYALARDKWIAALKIGAERGEGKIKQEAQRILAAIPEKYKNDKPEQLSVDEAAACFSRLRTTQVTPQGYWVDVLNDIVQQMTFDYREWGSVREVFERRAESYPEKTLQQARIGAAFTRGADWGYLHNVPHSYAINLYLEYGLAALDKEGKIGGVHYLTLLREAVLPLMNVVHTSEDYHKYTAKLLQEEIDRAKAILSRKAEGSPGATPPPPPAGPDAPTPPSEAASARKGVTPTEAELAKYRALFYVEARDQWVAYLQGVASSDDPRAQEAAGILAAISKDSLSDQPPTLNDQQTRAKIKSLTAGIPSGDSFWTSAIDKIFIQKAFNERGWGQVGAIPDAPIDKALYMTRYWLAFCFPSEFAYTPGFIPHAEALNLYAMNGDAAIDEKGEIAGVDYRFVFTQGLKAVIEKVRGEDYANKVVQEIINSIRQKLAAKAGDSAAAPQPAATDSSPPSEASSVREKITPAEVELAKGRAVFYAEVRDEWVAYLKALASSTDPKAQEAATALAAIPLENLSDRPESLTHQENIDRSRILFKSAKNASQALKGELDKIRQQKVFNKRVWGSIGVLPTTSPEKEIYPIRFWLSYAYAGNYAYLPQHATHAEPLNLLAQYGEAAIDENGKIAGVDYRVVLTEGFKPIIAGLKNQSFTDKLVQDIIDGIRNRLELRAKGLAALPHPGTTSSATTPLTHPEPAAAVPADPIQGWKVPSETELAKARASFYVEVRDKFAAVLRSIVNRKIGSSRRKKEAQEVLAAMDFSNPDTLTSRDALRLFSKFSSKISKDSTLADTYNEVCKQTTFDKRGWGSIKTRTEMYPEKPHQHARIAVAFKYGDSLGYIPDSEPTAYAANLYLEFGRAAVGKDGKIAGVDYKSVLRGIILSLMLNAYPDSPKIQGFMRALIDYEINEIGKTLQAPEPIKPSPSSPDNPPPPPAPDALPMKSGALTASEQAYFKEKGWPETASSPEEKLQLELRRASRPREGDASGKIAITQAASTWILAAQQASADAIAWRELPKHAEDLVNHFVNTGVDRETAGQWVTGAMLSTKPWVIKTPGKLLNYRAALAGALQQANPSRFGNNPQEMNGFINTLLGSLEGRRSTPDEAYHKVRNKLTELFKDEKRALAAIREGAMKYYHWSQDNSPEALLYTNLRTRLAEKGGGALMADPKGRYNADKINMLAHLGDEAISVMGRAAFEEICRTDVKAFLMSDGVAETTIDQWINNTLGSKPAPALSPTTGSKASSGKVTLDASELNVSGKEVFGTTGWPMTAESHRDKLRLELRKLFANNFGNDSAARFREKDADTYHWAQSFASERESDYSLNDLPRINKNLVDYMVYLGGDKDKATALVDAVVSELTADQ